jgi:hypothetical protein
LKNKYSAKVVLLTANPNVLLERYMDTKTKGAIEKEQNAIYFNELWSDWLTFEQPHWQECRDITIDTSFLTVDDVIGQIEADLNMSTGLSRKKVKVLSHFIIYRNGGFQSFTIDEREYIDSCYHPMGAPPHTLTQGTILERGRPAPEFLNGLNTWFRSSKDSGIAERIHQKLMELGKEFPIVKPGYYDGRHFTTYVRDFESIKNSGKVTELENLLLELVNATKAESAVNGMGVATAYYSELAILYRKQKEYSKEISILERFAKQKHTRGVMPAKLLEQLEKAKELAATQENKSG